MSDNWKTYSSAPAHGTLLCDHGALSADKPLSLMIGEFPLLVVLHEGQPLAYVNACPHQYLPLDRLGPEILSADGLLLRCTNHSAAFRLLTGEGVEGMGLGACLDPVPVTVNKDGGIVINDPS